MDDCDLEYLVVTPGKLCPDFAKSNLNYSLTIPASTEKVVLKYKSRDTGASINVKNPTGNESNVISLKHGGSANIQIEVTAEDGKTKKVYSVKAQRMSPKDAALTKLACSVGQLDPPFDVASFDYTVFVPATSTTVTFTTSPVDPKCALKINEKPPNQPVPLNLGRTIINIEVVSGDGSNKRIYKVSVIRNQLPRFIQLKDVNQQAQFEDPISLSLIYCPIKIQGTDRFYSEPMIRHLTRTCKADPLSGSELKGDWDVEDDELEIAMSKAEGSLVTSKGLSPVGLLPSLPNQLKSVVVAPKLERFKKKGNYKHMDLGHKSEVRDWEKQLRQIYDESEAGPLSKMAEESLTKYFEVLPSSPEYGKTYPEGQSPMDYLTHASQCYAQALADKPKDTNLHIRLGYVLEEKYWLEDMLGIKSKDDSLGSGALSMNQAAYESGREDEVQAICKMRGYNPPVSVALQLKALDEEVHALRDQNQTAKADAVMNLFLWKSKQANQEGVSAQKAESQESPLGQAFLKYVDALSIEDAKANNNYQVGRLLLIQGKYSDAISRLESALSWNEKLNSARFCLGLALGCSPKDMKDREDETVRLLTDGLELLMTELTGQACETRDSYKPPRRTKLYAEEFFILSNPLLVRGAIALGKILKKREDDGKPALEDCMTYKQAFHTAAHLCGMLMPHLSKGAVYGQLEWLLITAHSSLMDALAEMKDVPSGLIHSRCQSISYLINNATIPLNDKMMSVLEKACQTLVWTEPSNASAVYQLAQAMFRRAESSQYQSEEFKKYFNSSISMFLAAIDLEKKASNSPAPQCIQEQAWFKTKKENEAAKCKPAESAAPPADPAPAPSPAAAPAPAAKTPATSQPAAGRGKGAPAAKGPSTQNKPAAPAGRGRAPAKPAPQANKAAAPAKGAPAKSNTAPSKPAPALAAPEPEKPAEPKQPETPKEPETKEPEKAPTKVIINPVSYLPRLGLARAYKLNNQIDKAHDFYNKVIELKPELHDAYIESAEMLMAKGEKLKAVDIYAKYPFGEESSFDDAFIFGEIVTILANNEKFDDKRLPVFMIKWGRVMGFGVLEKTITKLENKFKFGVCRQVYAGVNGKSVDDPMLQQFFKMKCWD